MERMSLMLNEQRKINEELMGQMREMQMTMQDMRSNFGSRGGGGNSWNDDYDGFDGFGSGYGNGFGGGKMGNSGFMGGRNIPYNTRVATHEGDWDCPRCGNMNFARRMSCNKPNCGEPKRPEYIRRGQEMDNPTVGGPKSKMPGDWDCPKCGNMNFGRRTECNKGCGFKRSDLRTSGGPGLHFGLVQGDWECPKCNNINFSCRIRCNKKDCNFEKKDLENYEGYGNGQFGSGGFGGSGPSSWDDLAKFGMSGAPSNYRRSPEPGVWECPRCKNENYENRKVCNTKFKRGGEVTECRLRRPDFEKYGVKLVRGDATRRAGDWDCWRCGNINFKIRESCNKCQLPKEECQSDSLRDIPDDD